MRDESILPTQEGMGGGHRSHHLLLIYIYIYISPFFFKKKSYKLAHKKL